MRVTPSYFVRDPIAGDADGHCVVFTVPLPGAAGHIRWTCHGLAIGIVIAFLLAMLMTFIYQSGQPGEIVRIFAGSVVTMLCFSALGEWYQRRVRAHALSVTVDGVARQVTARWPGPPLRYMCLGTATFEAITVKVEFDWITFGNSAHKVCIDWGNGSAVVGGYDARTTAEHAARDVQLILKRAGIDAKLGSGAGGE